MTLYELVQRFVGEVREIPGQVHSPFIQWCFQSCGYGPDTADEVPWCSAFMNRMCWLLRKPRSKSARARSWLMVGVPIFLHEAQLGDVVILKQEGGPDSSVLVAPGHVGLFAGSDGATVLIMGGNQSDSVSIAPFKASNILGVRRI